MTGGCCHVAFLLSGLSLNCQWSVYCVFSGLKSVRCSWKHLTVNWRNFTAALRHSSCTAEVCLSLSVQHWDTRHAPQRSVCLSLCSIETLVMHRRGLFLSLSLCSGLFGILEWRPTSQPLTAYRMSYFTHSTYFSLFLLFKRGARCKGAEVLDDWSLNVNNRNG